MDLIKVKANLICHGILDTALAEDIYKLQNPNKMQKTGRYYGILIKLDDKLGVLANVIYNKTNKTKYKLSGTLDDLKLVTLDDEFVCKVTYTNPPRWYEKNTKTNKKATEVFVEEGEKYIHMAYSGCDYIKCNVGCKFCSCGSEINTPSAEEIAEIVNFAEIEKKYHVCLSGGTVLPLYKTTEKLKKILEKIRKSHKDTPIWVEMVPPSKKEIKELVEAGATSFSFNIEIYDEELRKIICPGKSAVSIEDYIERSVYANELLGGNKVCNTLICGIAPKETIKKGIDELTEHGIHPCILAFRPSEGSEFENKEECREEDFYECSEYAAKKALEHNLDIFKNEGCYLCGYCSLMHDITNEIIKG